MEWTVQSSHIPALFLHAYTAFPTDNTLTFVAIHKPALTRHYCPKSPVHIKVHAWCYTVYEFWQMYNDMYIYFCFIDYVKAFGCVDHHKLWKILKEMGLPDHLTCLLRNLDMEQQNGSK